jgi:hypothetical protein
MQELFRIESTGVTVRWQTKGLPPTSVGFADVPPVSATGALLGPVQYPGNTPAMLYEQCEYQIVVRSNLRGSRVELRHRDPNLIREVVPVEETTPGLLVGNINFRNQVGRSRFDVLVDGKHELSFEIEVFPSKLDYRSDYEQILAEIQDILRALAFEFLKATYTGAQPSEVQDTNLEWALMLRSVVDDLERGIRHIERYPMRSLRREVRHVRAERIRRPDGAVVRAARSGAGQGEWMLVGDGVLVRSRLPTRHAEPTLDTPEHRWLAEHLSRARRRIAQLVLEESSRRPLGRLPGNQQQKALEELRGIESRLDALLHTEPLEAASEPTKVGFTSLQLLGAPGYREASQALIALQLGLRLEGNALELSLKDISTLYEYWCFLAVLDLIAQRTGQSIDPHQLIELQATGLHVLLKKGESRAAKFPLGVDRTIHVEYNPQYRSYVLLPQQPDIVLAVEEPGRPTVRVVLDAKYRVDASSENVQQLGIIGPPTDALNVLHRYRDAILTEEPAPDESRHVARSVVYAAALYPATIDPEEFYSSKLARQLRTIGVGAVPFLPSNRGLLSEWLDYLLKKDGWSMGHGARTGAYDPWVWRAASEVVLVGVLRQPGAAEHLRWCFDQRAYYIPEPATRHGRQSATRYVALYLPAGLTDSSIGAVTYIGSVVESRTVPRVELSTPWSSRTSQEMVRLYSVAGWQRLERPIPNADRQRFSAPRWSSLLAVRRAARLAELALESPLEWDLYDALVAEGVEIEVRAAAVSPLLPDAQRSRARFSIPPSITVAYAGANGFRVTEGGVSETYTATVEKTIAFIRTRLVRRSGVSRDMRPPPDPAE